MLKLIIGTSGFIAGLLCGSPAVGSDFLKLIDYSEVKNKNSESVNLCRRYPTVHGSRDLVGIVQYAVERMQSNPVGKQLQLRIMTLLQVFGAIGCLAPETSPNISPKIRIKEQSGDSILNFQPSENNGCIQLNIGIDLRTNTYWHRRHGLCVKIPALCGFHKSEQNHEKEIRISVKACYSPLWIAITHELIHLEHYLIEQLNNFLLKFLYEDTGFTRFKRQYVMNNNPGSSSSLISGFVKQMSAADLTDCQRQWLIGLDAAELNQKYGDKVRQIRNVFTKYNGVGIDIIDQFFLSFAGCLGLKKQQQNDALRVGLVDYLNFLRNPERLHAHYKKCIAMGDSNALRSMGLKLTSFPELANEATRNEFFKMWGSLEERNTIIGPGCSELTLRLSDKDPFPVRFINQQAKTDESVFVLVKPVEDIVRVARHSIAKNGSYFNNSCDLKNLISVTVSHSYFDEALIVQPVRNHDQYRSNAKAHFEPLIITPLQKKFGQKKPIIVRPETKKK